MEVTLTVAVYLLSCTSMAGRKEDSSLGAEQNRRPSNKVVLRAGTWVVYDRLRFYLQISVFHFNSVPNKTSVVLSPPLLAKRSINDERTENGYFLLQTGCEAHNFLIHGLFPGRCVAYIGFYNTWPIIEEPALPDVIFNTPVIPTTKATKIILIWDTRNHIDFQVLMDRASMNRCPVSDCLLTQERTLAALHNADAVIFNAPPLKLEDFPVDPQRRPEQRYIFLSPEPPVLFADDVEKFNRVFNWTMSYKRDSDIPYVYGDIKPEKTTANSVTVKTARGKTKLVAWFVSHCFTQSRREAYVEQLRKHIDTDVYGDCNKQMLRCSQNLTTHLSDDSCYEMLERDYKFYLAFENSLCADYVTEKFFKILQRRVIPVVLGGADYSKIAPPHSYIDARRFSPQGLAAYLKRLAANDTLYNHFFHWKDHYSVKPRYPDMAEKALCHLCEKLHSDHSVSVHNNLESHWSGKSQCVRPRYKNLPLVFGVF